LNEVARGAAAKDLARSRAMDADLPTTHVRCGSDIRERLLEAGFEGSFVEFSDPVCQGPVPRTDDFVDVRARFVSERYGVLLADARERLRRELSSLEETMGAPRVVLWFEHDAYDQLILARILAFYREHGAPERLELICVEAFPGVSPFVGLGQLSAEQLGALWPARRAVTPDLLDLGAEIWDALRDASPVGLYQISERTSSTGGAPSALRPAGPALRRHLQELPWTTDGLGLTERLTLGLLADGDCPEEALFRRLTEEAEPLPFLGDAMYAAALDDLAAADRPAIRVVPAGGGEGRQVALTDVGRRIFHGLLNWRACSPPERWVGGVRISRGAPVWSWDPAGGRPEVM
jgi:Domain of unknown function (DUF1835)